jgi:NAD(P)-dependent dehydrogenase (short-subunit alcohol dehydrogenase family)
MARLARETPLYGRIATGDDIAKAIALMAGDDASFVTGANLMACAGFLII